MKTNILKVVYKHRRLYRILPLGLSMVLACIACEKSDDTRNTENGIRISKTKQIDELIDELDLPVDGGRDTFFVFSSSDISMSIQSTGVEEWVNIVDEQYVTDLKATRVILEAIPLEDNLDRRVGTLNIGNKDQYTRKFLKLRQGFGRRYSNDFSWLRYGNGNPLNQTNTVLISQWNPTQKQEGWTSTSLEGQTTAYVYGMNNYVQIGSDKAGANFLSPFIPSIERDSLLVLSFNAVAFVSQNGEPDGNKLTIKLSGVEFENGEEVHVVDVPHFDKESALLISKMWENTWFKINIIKPESNPTSSRVQIEFISGDGKPIAKNRILLDNVKLYTKAQFEEQKK